MGDRWCVCVRVRTRGKYAITDGVQSACLETREIVKHRFWLNMPGSGWVKIYGERRLFYIKTDVIELEPRFTVPI